MPVLRILTNAQVPAEDRTTLLARASRTVADLLGKPESYVMVILEDGRDMVFAGTLAPSAYLELKSLGLPEDRTTQYPRALCALMTDALGIPGERVYIEFAAPARQMFGWNGGTF
jgi:phenylpyruvate tautomerase